MIKLKSPGRGGQFSIARGIVETLQSLVFAGRWPARVLDRVPAATRVQLIEHELHLSDGEASAGAELAPLRLAFISDLHIGPLTPPKLLDNAFQLLAQLAPDVLVLGGDYVFLDVNQAMARELEERVAAVPARTKLAVLGNHDLWTHHDLIERALERAGCRVLINDAQRLRRRTSGSRSSASTSPGPGARTAGARSPPVTHRSNDRGLACARRPAVRRGPRRQALALRSHPRRPDRVAPGPGRRSRSARAPLAVGPTSPGRHGPVRVARDRSGRCAAAGLRAVRRVPVHAPVKGVSRIRVSWHTHRPR